MRLLVRLLALLAASLPGGLVTHSEVSAQSTPCQAPLTLVLQPGAHYPGAQSFTPPADRPPGPLTLSLPLYPGAQLTTQTEPVPTLGVPAVLYLKSASATFDAPAGADNVTAWYTAAFAACGYTLDGEGSAGGPQGSSTGITEAESIGTTQVSVDLSFADDGHGGTLVLYVALAITPPVYPAPGSPLRVPGTVVSVSITQYAGLNGPHPTRAVRAVTVKNGTQVTALAHTINYLPKPIDAWESCPLDDGSHDSLVFTDSDGSQHPVYIGLRGCQSVVVPPPAPPGTAGSDPTLLPQIDSLLQGPGSYVPAYPFDAKTLHVTGARRLGPTPGRFLSTGQNGTHLLYVSQGRLYTAPAAGGAPRLLASGVSNATFDVDDLAAVARMQGAPANRLTVINTSSLRRSHLDLPAGASLVGPEAGIGRTTLSTSLENGQHMYLWYTAAGRLEAVDPQHPRTDAYRSPRFLPPPDPGRLLAVSPLSLDLALFQPSRGLVIRNIGGTEGRIGPVVLHLALRRVTFLSWVPDGRSLLYRQGDALFLLNVPHGHRRLLLHLGSRVIHASAFDPYNHVLALATSAPGPPATSSRVVLVNLDGSGSRNLALPFAGITSLDWDPWQGKTLGVTRDTPGGRQAWAISLPTPAPDPAAWLFGG